MPINLGNAERYLKRLYTHITSRDRAIRYKVIYLNCMSQSTFYQSVNYTYADYDAWKTLGLVVNFPTIGEPSLSSTAQTYVRFVDFPLIKRIIWISIYLPSYTEPSWWLYRAYTTHTRISTGN